LKIICISDTHNQHQVLTDELIDLYKLYPDAILIHSGDACLAGTKKEAIDFLEWFGNLPFESKIFIPGNHDIAFDKAFSYIDYVELQEFAENKSINLLINDVYNIKTLKIVACSLIPFLSSWAFFADDSQRERFFEYIDQDADLIISHSPPYGCGDRASRGFGKFEHTGCKYLRNYIDRNNTPIVINGHIHEDFGLYNYKNTKVFNCSIMDARYNVSNRITIFDL
jgi:Icc-related predicted phosphoesterase